MLTCTTRLLSLIGLRRPVPQVLDEMGPVEPSYETDAVNVTALPNARTATRIDDFTVEIEEVRLGGWGVGGFTF